MKSIVGFICLLLAMRADALAKRRIKLSSGFEMPVAGLDSGTINADQVEQAVSSALEIGYRYIDTDIDERKEVAVGKAIKKWFDEGYERNRIFVTSKLPSHVNKLEDVEKYLKRSLVNLGLEHVDMYLLHRPFVNKEGQKTTATEYEVLENEANHVALWKEMEKQVASGRVRSIGLSNFNETQILNVYDNAVIKPSYLRVESHLYFQQPKLQKLCKDKNIAMTTYAPLSSTTTLHAGTARELPPAIQLPLVKKLAGKYGKTCSQILLRHAYQRGIGFLTASANSERQREYIYAHNFYLSEDEMKQMDDLDKGETGRMYDFVGRYNTSNKTGNTHVANFEQLLADSTLVPTLSCSNHVQSV